MSIVFMIHSDLLNIFIIMNIIIRSDYFEAIF